MPGNYVPQYWKLTWAEDWIEKRALSEEICTTQFHNNNNYYLFMVMGSAVVNIFSHDPHDHPPTSERGAGTSEARAHQT